MYCEENIKSYCGHCEKMFGAEVYYCPACGSNLVSYDTAIPTEKFSVQNRWDRHNRNFNSQRKEIHVEKHN